MMLRMMPYRSPKGAWSGLVVLMSLMLLGAMVPAVTAVPADGAAQSRATPAVAVPRTVAHSLVFTPAQGRAAHRAAFQARTPHGTLFFTPGAVVLALPVAVPPETPRSVQALRDAVDRRDALGLDRVLREVAAPDLVRTLRDAFQRGDAPTVTQALTALAHAPRYRTVGIAVQLVGANPTTTLQGTDSLPGVIHDLRGTDPAQWQTHLPTYAALVYRDLYPGIDLRYDGAAGALKGTYLVQPGADPTQIRWRYTGVATVEIDPTTGNLHSTLPSPDRAAASFAPPTLIEHAPVAWQVRTGRQHTVPVRYQLAANGDIRFQVGTYDPTLPLIIDPTLEYSTYLGGSDDDSGKEVVVDAQGQVSIVGTTYSDDFPTTTGAYTDTRSGPSDIFVTKLAADGQTLVSSTYLGGSGDDFGHSIALDSSGNSYLTGRTYSTDFPLVNGYQPTFGGGSSDAFALKLNPAGDQVLYSTYLGGTWPREHGSAIQVDSSGIAYLTGKTGNSGVPTFQGFQTTGGNHDDGFLVALDMTRVATDSLRYGTYLGGSDYDEGWALAVDGPETVIVVGDTYSTDFPIPAGSTPYQGTKGVGTEADAFVLALDTTQSGSASLRASTYLGGADIERARGVVLDAAQTLYLAGTTCSSDFPVVNPRQTFAGGQCDAFVTRVHWTDTATSVGFSTTFGGSTNEYTTNLARDPWGNLILLGFTSATDFPLVQPIQAQVGGGKDMFVTQLSGYDQSLRFSTYLGGSGDDHSTQMGLAIAADGTIALTGPSASPDFPAAEPCAGCPAQAGTRTVVAKLRPPMPQVSAGGRHTCLVTRTGQLACSGHDTAGSVQDTNEAASAFFQVSAGAGHTCGVDADAQVACWGDDTFGQATPVITTSYTQVSAGWRHSCGVQTDGTLTCWGDDTFGQATLPATAPLTYTQVAVGQDFTCGIGGATQQPVCWGRNTFGQASPPTAAMTTTHLSVGRDYACGVRGADGSLVCWGNTFSGQVTDRPAGAVTQVVAGTAHLCAVNPNETLVCWGWNDTGQTSSISGGYVQVSAGGQHSCGVTTTGTVQCWGANDDGQATPPVSE